jgi:hypothetical protein
MANRAGQTPVSAILRVPDDPDEGRAMVGRSGAEKPASRSSASRLKSLLVYGCRVKADTFFF